MMEPPPHEYENELEIERKRQATAVKAAFELLEQNPEFPSTQVEIYDRQQELERNASEETKQRLSEPRFEHCLGLLDIQAGGLLRLLTNQESLKAYAIIVQECARLEFIHLSGITMESVQPTPPFMTVPNPPLLLYRDRFVEKMREWIVEGYRRLDSLHKPKTERARRGYRKEVLEWMSAKGLESVEQAARRLGVSKSLLKSIMSDKGKLRYGPETLKRVLGLIGYNKKGE